MSEELTKYNLFADWYRINGKRRVLNNIRFKDYAGNLPPKTDEDFKQLKNCKLTAPDQIRCDELKKQSKEVFYKICDIGCEDLLYRDLKDPVEEWDKLKNMPVAYGVVDHNLKREGHYSAYRVQVNAEEYFVKPDICEFMNEVGLKYRHKRFHAGDLMQDLHDRKRIMADPTRLSDLFQGKKMKELQKILFKSFSNGEYITNIEIWL